MRSPARRLLLWRMVRQTKRLERSLRGHFDSTEVNRTLHVLLAAASANAWEMSEGVLYDTAAQARAAYFALRIDDLDDDLLWGEKLGEARERLSA